MELPPPCDYIDSRPVTLDHPLPRFLVDFVKEKTRDFDKAHDLEHAIRVLSNAWGIVRKEKLDLSERQKMVLMYGAMVHDVLDHKLIARGLAPGPEVVRDFLDTKIGTELAGVIMHIIDNISWSKRHTSEPSTDEFEIVRRIIRDADWLEAIGEVGLNRCIQYTYAVGGVAPWDVTRHILEKLLLIRTELHFASSRELAGDLEKPLHDYLREYGAHGTVCGF